MSAPPPDLLAIDHPSALAANRGIYRRLQAMGLAVEVVIPQRLPHLAGRPEAEPDQPGDPPLHRLPFAGRRLRYLRIEGLEALLQARRPRALHWNNEPDTPGAFRLGGWCRANGALLTAQSADSELFPLAQSLRAGAWRHLLRGLRTRACLPLTAPRIDRIFCLSQQIATGWGHLGLGDKTLVMPLGVDCARFRPDGARRAEWRARLGLTEPTVAFFGRLAPRKGVHELVAALCRLADSRWQFLVNDYAPEGSYAEGLFAPLEALGLASRRVVFRARHLEVADYMRAADLVVVPSLWEEQYGRVAAEAMACGTAVVAYRRGALPEVLSEAGCLLPAGDVAGLASAINCLLADASALRRLGDAGRRRALAALSLERQAAVMAGALRALWQARERRQ